MERQLPQNIDAERGVLGSIIIDPEAIALIADMLRPADFYRDAHRTLYGTMLRLYERRDPPDSITLSDELERDGKLADVGGDSYIASLINELPTSGNIEYYARIVAKKAQMRRLISAAGKIAALAYEEQEDAITQAEALIYQIAQNRQAQRLSPIADVMSRYMNKLDRLSEKRRQGQVAGVPTGFALLDRVLGGLQPSDLVTLAARPAQGKTSLALNIAQHVMVRGYTAGYRTLMFSLEMGEEQLARRLLSMETGIDQSRLRSGDVYEHAVMHRGKYYDSEWALIIEKIGKLSEGAMWIDDTPGISVSDMRSRARRVQSEHGLDLIIVDYMQLMRATNADGKAHENRVQEVSAISRNLKELARELNVPVLALAQLSRAVEQRADKVPQLSDLRESGTIEQDSDVVMFIHQDPSCQVAPEGYQLNIIVAKHRNGPTGVAPLWFNPRLTQFADMAQPGTAGPGADNEEEADERDND